MTDVLIASMTYTVETLDVDWWGETDDVEESDYTPDGRLKPEKAKERWSGVQAGLKTYAEADAFAQKLLQVYRKVRIVKHVKYIESVFGE